MITWSSVHGDAEPPRGRQIPGVPGCEFLVGAFTDHAFPRHSHEGLMLSVIDGGEQRVECRGETLVAGPGQVIAVAPEEPHRSGAGITGWWRYHSLMVPPAASPELGEGLRVAVRAPAVIDDAKLAAAVRGITIPLLAGEVLAVQCALAGVLRLFLERHGKVVPRQEARQGREDQAVALAQAYLRTSLDRTVSLAGLARVTGIDGSRLTRAFTRAVGLPPHAWHLQARLREGQNRLSRGASVADTAAATGFADQPHFTRAFKRLVGVTPAAFRAEHRRAW